MLPTKYQVASVMGHGFLTRQLKQDTLHVKQISQFG